MPYQPIQLNEFLPIHHVYTIHYFEYMCDFSFPGETHDFWEFLCVDKGNVIVQSDTTQYTLNEGDIIFHKPNEFHNIRANGKIAPNLVVISFSSHSPNMKFFEDKLFSLEPVEKVFLANIITEAKKTYSTILGDPYYTKLVKNTYTSPESEHFIKIHLESLLLNLHRRYNSHSSHTTLSLTTSTEDTLYLQIHDYLMSNIQKPLTLKTISTDLLINASKLQKIIKHYHQCSLIEYFSMLKIDFIKQLIRSRTLNLSQIADYMGYSSIHYFSRQFKHITGMTPSQYAASIKAISEYPNPFEL